MAYRICAFVARPASDRQPLRINLHLNIIGIGHADDARTQVSFSNEDAWQGLYAWVEPTWKYAWSAPILMNKYATAH